MNVTPRIVGEETIGNGPSGIVISRLSGLNRKTFDFCSFICVIFR